MAIANVEAGLGYVRPCDREKEGRGGGGQTKAKKSHSASNSINKGYLKQTATRKERQQEKYFMRTISECQKVQASSKNAANLRKLNTERGGTRL